MLGIVAGGIGGAQTTPYIPAANSTPIAAGAVMSLSMYQIAVPTFQRFLQMLDTTLDKAAAYAEARKIDPAALLTARLYPDMHPLTRQIHLACDAAKGAGARLAGVPVPSHPDVETTFPELKERIAKTRAFLDTLKPEQMEGSEDRTVTLQLRSGEQSFKGQDYLLNFALPNFYFHCTTTYAILRHNGLEIGKLDFLSRR
jgi:hypothetical protein